MIQLTLEQLANQTFTTRLDNSFYEITIKEANGIMAATIVRDNVIIISSARMLPGVPILPYQYLENGNFVMVTTNDELPFYTLFGISQFLIFASETELEAIRGT